MKRRQVINSLLIGAGVVAVAGNLKWLRRSSVPDLKMLSENRLLIAELAETIIPATDTPGARDAKVEDFILKVIINCDDPRQQRNFIEGLLSVQKFSRDKFGRTFENCTAAERILVLDHFEQSESTAFELIDRVRYKVFGDPFFSVLKHLTVVGYCTSKPGATQGLDYLYLPGGYQACTPLVPGQRSWATR